MAETSLGKLQIQVTKLEQKVIKLTDDLAKEREEKQLYKLKYEKLKKDFDKKVEELVDRDVKQAIAQVVEKYEKEIEKRDKRIFELETRLNIDSSNSSLPSSKTPIHKTKICNSREKSEKSKGGQPGHKKHQLEKFYEEEITETEEHTTTICPCCLETDLEKIDQKERDELDFDIKIIKRRHKFYTYQCRNCGQIIETQIPLNLHAENQYGSKVKTLGLALADLGFVSYNRSRKFICGLTSGEINPSEGYLVKLGKKASEQLKDFVFDVKEHILKAELVGWDDTVIAIAEKSRACLRVYTDGVFALYKAHMAKDTDGMDKSMEYFLDKIEDSIDYNKWYCGHYHTEKIVDNLEFMFGRIKVFNKDEYFPKYNSDGYEIVRDYCKQDDINNREVCCPKCNSSDISILKGDGRYIDGLDEIAIICNKCRKVYGFSDVKYYSGYPKEL
ncbi:MAG: hypothetical protein J6B64_01920 [Bacilli bacterium]|nr:hypothetical protein [Bacilli bacterium]MBP3921313.1 hypothetical protein [Bacilli bacterium]